MVGQMNIITQRLRQTYRFLQIPIYLLGADGIGLAQNYMTASLFPEYSDGEHLNATMQWLCRAQDVCKGNGVSAMYSLKKGWGVAYPETSGYIIATYLAYADHSGDENYIKRAIQIGNWEIDIQAPNGGVLSNPEVSYTRVFNTGQVILGWCSLYERTQDEKYLRAALRAGEYLVKGQEDDGAWHKDTHCGARTYHSRIDWALIRLALLSGKQKFAETAVKNLKWVILHQNGKGWFNNCGFCDDLPIMHVIVYTLRGLLESHCMNVPAVNELDLLPKITLAADALCAALLQRPVRGVPGMVPTSFDEKWQSEDDHSCLTGNAQLAGFLLRLSHVTGNSRYRDVAESVIQATKRTQNITTSYLPIRGAIAGSYPLHVSYVPNGFPNWAAKFFADALMMKMHFDQAMKIAA
jgi:hypothetical protein